jgi:hypothetical protein
MGVSHYGHLTAMWITKFLSAFSVAHIGEIIKAVDFDIL